MATKVYPVCLSEYTVVAEAQEYSVNFKVYEIMRDDDDLLSYEGKSGMETTSLQEARVYLSGSVKWDGCMDLKFDRQEHISLHFCGMRGINQLSELLQKLLEITAELCPTFAPEEAYYMLPTEASPA